MAYTLEEIEKGFVHIEDGPTYECYFPKTRQYWNGWAVPVGLTAKSLCDFIDESMRSYNHGETTEDAEWCVELLTSIRTYEYGELTIYGVGDGLIWTECDAQGEE